MEKEAFTGLVRALFEEEREALATVGFNLSPPDLDSAANLLYNRSNGDRLNEQEAKGVVTAYVCGYRHGLLTGKEKGREERMVELCDALAY